MFNTRKTASLILLAAFASVAAHADDYRFELGAAFERANLDFDDEFGDVPDVDSIAVSGHFYLNPVPTDGVPLAEAAFLNRSSFVNAAAQRFDDGDDTFDVFAANFGYYIPNTMFYGRLGVIKFDDVDAGDDTLVTGTVGITPFKGLLVTTDFDEDGWNPNASARYVGQFGNQKFYAAGITVVDPDNDDLTFSADFDYYFDHTFSVGGSVGEDIVGIRAEKFFTPSFAVGARAYTADDVDGFGAHVKWRF
ncbi:MAG TPA: putative porin [Vicinamibacterales bacterium]|nr:putative porin [Vicinamibacterales bacterium]